MKHELKQKHRLSHIVDGTTYFYQLLPDGTVAIVGCQPGAPRIVVPSRLDDRPVTRLGGALFADKRGLEEVVLPEGLTHIAAGTFRGCTSLKDVSLPDGITVLPESAFAGCANLRTVRLPTDLLEIQREAFRGCGKLPGVLLPKGLEEVGMNAFADCASLTSIHLPDSLRALGCTRHGKLAVRLASPEKFDWNLCANPFTRCVRLEQVKLSPDHPYLRLIDGCLILKRQRALVACLPGEDNTHRRIPEGVIGMAQFALTSCPGLKTVTLPESFVEFNHSLTSLAGFTFQVHRGSQAHRTTEMYRYSYRVIEDSPDDASVAPEAIPSVPPVAEPAPAQTSPKASDGSAASIQPDPAAKAVDKTSEAVNAPVEAPVPEAVNASAEATAQTIPTDTPVHAATSGDAPTGEASAPEATADQLSEPAHAQDAPKEAVPAESAPGAADPDHPKWKYIEPPRLSARGNGVPGDVSRPEVPEERGAAETPADASGETLPAPAAEVEVSDPEGAAQNFPAETPVSESAGDAAGSDGEEQPCIEAGPDIPVSGEIAAEEETAAAPEDATPEEAQGDADGIVDAASEDTAAEEAPDDTADDASPAETAAEETDGEARRPRGILGLFRRLTGKR